MPKRIGCLYERMLDLELIKAIIISGSERVVSRCI